MFFDNYIEEITMFVRKKNTFIKIRNIIKLCKELIKRIKYEKWKVYLTKYQLFHILNTNS